MSVLEPIQADLVTRDEPGLSVEICERLSPDEEQCCREFVRSSPSGSYLQRPEWPRLAGDRQRFVYRYLVCRSGTRIVAFAVIRLSRLPLNRAIAAIRRGPVTRDLADLERSLPVVLSALRKAGFCTVTMNPRWEGEDATAALRILRHAGGEILAHDMQPLHTATGYVDLARDEDAILASFKQRGRRQLRKAAESGLTIREAACLEDAAAYAPVLRAFNDERGLADGAPSAEDQWRLAREGGVFLLCYLGSELVGGHVVIRDGGRAFWLSMASRDIDPAIPKNYGLVWEAMRRMKAAGCSVYDFAGMPDPRRGEKTEPDRAEANRSQFKSAFAPRMVDLTPMVVFAIRPLAHAVLFNARQAYRRGRSR